MKCIMWILRFMFEFYINKALFILSNKFDIMLTLGYVQI